MQAELDQVGESTGLMSLRQTEYFDGDEKHLKFLEGYPEVRLPGRHFASRRQVFTLLISLSPLRLSLAVPDHSSLRTSCLCDPLRLLPLNHHVTLNLPHPPNHPFPPSRRPHPPSTHHLPLLPSSNVQVPPNSRSTNHHRRNRDRLPLPPWRGRHHGIPYDRTGSHHPRPLDQIGVDETRRIVGGWRGWEEELRDSEIKRGGRFGWDEGGWELVRPGGQDHRLRKSRDT
jgi:hypothetical protein